MSVSSALDLLCFHLKEVLEVQGCWRNIYPQEGSIPRFVRRVSSLASPLPGASELLGNPAFAETSSLEAQ